MKAEIIGRLTGLTVKIKPVSAADDAARPVNTVREMGAIGAIFLNGVEADRARRTQQAVADRDGPVVPTDQDGSRIANTVAPTAPLLRPLLITAGIGRNRPVECRGTGVFGLKRLVDGADGVIDPTGRVPPTARADMVASRRLDRLLPEPYSSLPENIASTALAVLQGVVAGRQRPGTPARRR